ncbi:MAG TPA: DUF4407 domain-containing protein [Cyclobacteriaceae bacterium]|nr:DUF4407 domain-containing protein [Cyclobacteriaceae bacterium]
MEKLKLFFWYCSGANIDLLKKCPTESSKYVGIGATIFFTGIFASLAAGYALYTVFDNIWAAIGLGLIWGLMIFNLDRYIVSSMRKDGNRSREFAAALPRLVLALLISLIIAKPLEMKIFEKEIQSELVIMEQQIITAQESEIKQRFQPDQEKTKTEIASLKQEVATKTATRDELNRIAQQEADGTGGSKKRNAGPIYKIKKADADRANHELEELIKKTDALINQKLLSIANRDSSQTSETSALTRQKIDGPAARMEALSRLTTQHDAIWWANWFVILLFIAVETAPVFIKLISNQGPYDHLLKITEHGFEAQRIEQVAVINADVKSRTEKLPTTESDFAKDRLDIRLNESA